MNGEFGMGALYLLLRQVMVGAFGNPGADAGIKELVELLNGIHKGDEG
jgi:hypothetical protein